MSRATVVRNGLVIDGTGREPIQGATVLIEDGPIIRVDKDDAVEIPEDSQVFELDGRIVMPALSDAHVHLGIVDLSVSAAQRESLVVWAMKVRQVIEDVVEMGFTTVRDAGGIDGGFAQAVAEGHIRGPRILPSGSPISQTGGHGDWRQRFQEEPLAAIPGLLSMPTICDGADEVRRAARQQLRYGATQLKVMAAGGAMSPADELNTTQLTMEEMSAAVHEAAAVGKIVMAHTYSPGSIVNALDAGVRSIEHGNFLDEATAVKMKNQGAFLVPTLTTYELIDRFGEQYGIPQFNLEKTREAKNGGLESVQIAMSAGVKIGSGSDLLAAMQPHKTMELSLKAKLMGPMAAIVSATRTNAELFGMADKLGTLEAGKWADIIVVDGNPLEDIERLRDKNNVMLVLKQGAVLKNLLEP
jgi:imidazolonepropionase-like amidohydrolase